MIPADKTTSLSPPHQKALQRAFLVLENPRFAARLADYAGQPVRRVLRMLPKAANAQLSGVVESAVLRCLRVAINSIEPASKGRPQTLVPTILVGLSGGVSGVFGVAALPLELPLSTTIMLRAIADIARYAGEDLSTLEARLACIEVFGLGSGDPENRFDAGYFASRVLLSKLAGDASALILERGVAGASAPATNRLVVEIASRFGIVIPGAGRRRGSARAGSAWGGHVEPHFHEPLSAHCSSPFHCAAPRTGVWRRCGASLL